MIDSIEPGHSLASLLEGALSGAFDWDISAVADWPNIVATQTSRIMPTDTSAGSEASASHHAR
jgi:hypothetical protein